MRAPHPPPSPSGPGRWLAVAIAKPEAAPRIVKLVDKPALKDRRAMRLAQLEATLLDPKTLGNGETGKATR